MNDVYSTAQKLISSGKAKAEMSFWKILLLGILSGAFIAFGAAGSNAVIYRMSDPGLAKALAGILFSAGLMMVVFFGGELFTGNMVMVIPLFNKTIRTASLLKNWVFAFIGNFIGAIIIVFLIVLSGQLDFGMGDLGAATLKTAVYKSNLTFVKGLSLGILCNWLVCMAVWMSAAASTAAGKILSIFFPIWLFVASGFEHSIANMYYIPAGILIKNNSSYMSIAINSGMASGGLDNLNWTGFFVNNLIPVTLGNMLGGIIFVGFAAYIAHVRKKEME